MEDPYGRKGRYGRYGAFIYLDGRHHEPDEVVFHGSEYMLIDEDDDEFYCRHSMTMNMLERYRNELRKNPHLHVARWQFFREGDKLISEMILVKLTEDQILRDKVVCDLPGEPQDCASE